MAKSIKGITIKLGAETSGLDKALKGVNDSARKIQSELKSVNSLLKFNPQSVELMTQKKELLAKQVENTKEKLEKLKEAEKQVQAQFEKGDIGEEQYRAFKREVEATESKLKHYQNQVKEVDSEQQNLTDSLKRMDRFFQATGDSVEDFEDVLGTKLVNAIKDGKASAKDLDVAFDKMAKSALGTEADIDKLKKTLKQLDSGSSIDDVRKDLNKLADEANEATEEVEELGVGLENALAGAAAGVGIGKIVEESLSVSEMDTKIDITFDVPEESKESVKDAVRQVTTYGVDAEEALAGVRKQWALNADATDEQNAAIIESAGVIASAYDKLDFEEVIQETNKVSSALEISDEEALGLMNSLLKVGFPPDQLDIIGEYGTQLQMAGYDAEQVQAIMAAGVETGTWNIDNLLDGLKEGRIRVAEFGDEVPKALSGLIEGTGLSEDQFKKWGEAVANGGVEGQQAMVEVAQAVDGVEDSTKRNLIGAQVFGTMWEDQGSNITDTIINANENLVSMKDNQDALNGSVERMNEDPAVKMSKAIANMKKALAPTLDILANVIGKIAEWAAANPGLTATFVAIGSVVGIVLGILSALAPLFLLLSSNAGILAGAGAAVSAVMGGLSTVAGLVATAIGAISAPVLIVIGAIAAMIAIGVALYKNWDTVKEKAAQLGEFLSGKWDEIKNWTSEKWNGIKESLSQTWNNIKTSASEKFESIKATISSKWNSVKEKTSSTWGSIKENVSSRAESIRSSVASKWDSIKSKSSSVWESVKSDSSSKLGSLATTVSSKLADIKGFFDRLKLKLPKIKLPKLPKFTITGDFGFNPPRVPKLGIKWNAEGAIFTKPHIFGNQGVGEAGPEAVLPISKLAGMIADTMKKLDIGSMGSSNAVIDHTGTITIKGTNDRGQTMDVGEVAVEAVIRKLRREGRL